MTILNTDLMTIARSGIKASTELLNTTGNNIANVNSDGFVRSSTSFTDNIYGGVSRGTTERVIDVFAQNQLRRDTTALGEFESYYERASVIDDVFASDSLSLATSMSSFFESINTATDDATNLAARQLVLEQAGSLVGQAGTLAEFLDDKVTELNTEMDAVVDNANSLIQTISDLNDAISVSKFSTNSNPTALENERDLAVLELAELVDISVRESGDDDGKLLINTTSGESLVLKNGSFNLFQLSGDPDASYRSLELTSTDDDGTTLGLDSDKIGGTIGGMLNYRDEVLETSRRELGQITLALTEAMNSQNKLGMDLDQELGEDIFTLPQFIGLNYDDNADATLGITAQVYDGGASSLTSADYQVTIDGTTTGTPDTIDITVALLNPDGSPVTDSTGTAITQSYTGLTAEAGTFNEVIGGLEIEFADGDSYSAGDQFLLQPTKSSAADIEVAMTRPEDLAFALPVRIEADLDNLGGAELTNTVVTNTTVDNTFTDTAASGFDGSGGIHSSGAGPGGVYGAPAEIVFTSDTDFQVLDDAGLVIATVSTTGSFDNVLAQAQASVTWPAAFSAMDNYPGYDFSIDGVPQAGDSFTISYNTDGVADNRNALQLGDLQNTDTVLSDNSGNDNTVSFHEAYSLIISDVGGKTASADISMQAADAMKTQSENWFESVSGVSLDEEASNLVRYQQSYSASARLLSVSQDIFNTILSAL